MRAWWLFSLGLVGCGRIGFDPLDGVGPGGLPRAAVIAGGGTTCSIIDGTVRCWGDGRDGQLADGASAPHARPERVAVLDGSISLDIGDHHACAVRPDRKVWCWGQNSHGQLGDPGDARTAPTITVVLPAPAVQVAVGDYHTCAVLETGDVYCWGKNYAGQIGYGPVLPENREPTRSLIADVIEIAAGGWTTCARKSDGAVWCWGENYAGQLGRGTETSGEGMPMQVAGVTATAISVGSGAACALDAGHFRCWGTYHLLGNDTVTEHKLPQAPSLLDGLVDLRVGGSSACASTDDGRVYCWGSDEFGQLGDGGAWASTTEPHLVAMPDLAHASVGAAHACALQGDQVACWGHGEHGQLGDGRDLGGTAQPVMGLGAGINEVSVGADFACAKSDTEVWCWGSDDNAQLADGGGDPRALPIQVPTFGMLQGLTAGAKHACTWNASGISTCWGANFAGQLGTGNTDFVAGTVSPLASVTEMAAGEQFTCAQTAGAVACWGGNYDGQLGDGTLTARELPGPLVPPITAAGLIRIATGTSHACAFDNATTSCWGSNGNGELGLGDALGRSMPVAQSVGPILYDVSAGRYHSCGLAGTGQPYCWGANYSGQLALDNSYLVPTALTTPDLDHLDVGGSTSCGIESASDKTVCWGENSHGQLGDGLWNPRSELKPVTGLPVMNGISVGDTSACAVNLAGEVWCWGNNDRGQLGRGTMSSAPSPVLVTP